MNVAWSVNKIKKFLFYEQKEKILSRMEEGYVILNKSTSRVVTFGGYIDRPLQKQNVVLIIPGKM